MKPYYETELGKLYHGDCLEILPQLTEKVDLVLTDPPYFEVKGAFDFVWDSFDDYLLDVEKWASECKKILTENGTLYWFGSSKRIAYSQIIFDRFFGLVNNLVWEKAETDGLFGSTGSEQLRSYPNSTERLLMYSNDIYNLTQCVYSIRDYIREEIIRAKGRISLKEINEALGTAINGGGVASSCLSLDKTEPAMLTKEMYEKLRAWLNGEQDCKFLRRDYEELRRDYEELRRPFNNIFKSTEVIKVRFSPSEYKHDTVKPEKLISMLIQTSSRKNNLVLDFFLGSGTTAVACERLGRRWIGIEIRKEYCDIAVKRIERERSQLKLCL